MGQNDPRFQGNPSIWTIIQSISNTIAECVTWLWVSYTIFNQTSKSKHQMGGILGQNLNTWGSLSNFCQFKGHDMKKYKSHYFKQGCCWFHSAAKCLFCTSCVLTVDKLHTRMAGPMGRVEKQYFELLQVGGWTGIWLQGVLVPQQGCHHSKYSRCVRG